MQRTFRLRRIAPGALAFVCALALLQICGVRTAVACPVPPRLSETISDANAIVVATVRDVAVEQKHVGDNDYTVELVTLDIAQSLKGPFDGSQPLTVAGMFDLGDGNAGANLYLVFIGTPEGEGDLIAYESIDVTDKWRRDVFVERVVDFLATLDIEDRVEMARRQGEWAVRCVEDEPTRDWGMRELGRTGIAYDVENDGSVSTTDTTDQIQVERLITVLQSIDRPGEAYPLLSYLARYRDMRVVDQLRTWIADTRTGERDDTGWLMQLAAEQLQWTTGQWLAARYYDAETPSAKLEIRTRFENMIVTLDELPEALAADAEARANAENEDEIVTGEGDYEAAQLPESDVVVEAPDEVVVSVEELQEEPASEVESPQR